MIFNNFFKKDEVIDYNFCLNLPQKKYPEYLMKIFKQKMGYTFNLKKPKTLNEIIQYLKIYDNTPLKSYLTDKTVVNDYVKSSFGNHKIIKEIYGIYNSINDVDFSTLPNKFIIKMNNSCRANVPILDKSKITEKYFEYILNYFNDKQNENYSFVNGFELQYKDILPKIIIERLYPKISEYQILCTEGEPLFVAFLDEKNHIYNKIFHLNEYGNIIENCEIKDKISEMLEISKVLSKPFKLVRVDFMLVNKQYLFFQELTFTPYSGFACDIEEYNSEKYALPCLENIRRSNG